MNKGQIKKARQANIAEYLQRKGEPLVCAGHRHRHIKHDSLVFTENSYYWNSRNEHGNAVDYLMRHMGMDFKTAVYELTGAVDDQKKSDHKEKKPFSLSDIEIEQDMYRTITYLCKTRGISRDIINDLIKNKMLYQEATTNNILFQMYNEQGEIVGAETCGTLADKRFKGIKSGSKYSHGFNIKSPCKAEYILFFESVIDLISFVDIEQQKEKSLDNSILVSMGGLKYNVVKYFLGVFDVLLTPARRFVEIIRKNHSIPKIKGNSRQYAAVDDPPMGHQMQVDMGEIWVLDANKRSPHKALLCSGGNVTFKV